MIPVGSTTVRNTIDKMQLLLMLCGHIRLTGDLPLVFAYITYQFLAYPSVWGGNTFAYSYVAISFVLGMAIYLGSNMYHSRRDIDITLAYKEIPPE